MTRPARNKESARAEQRLATAARLRDAARALIAERGFSGTTVRAIAEQTGLAAGTVLAHFGSKEDLFFEVFYRDLDAIADRATKRAARARSLEARLVAFATGMFESFAAEPQLYGELMRHGLLARGPWGQRFEQQVHRVGVTVAGWYPPGVADLRAAVMNYFAIYYFVLIGLLKSDFETLPSGLASLRAMVSSHVEGIR